MWSFCQLPIVFIWEPGNGPTGVSVDLMDLQWARSEPWFYLLPASLCFHYKRGAMLLRSQGLVRIWTNFPQTFEYSTFLWAGLHKWKAEGPFGKVWENYYHRKLAWCCWVLPLSLFPSQWVLGLRTGSGMKAEQEILILHWNNYLQLYHSPLFILVV